MTPHIESKKEDIAPIVLMPGDPLRAKYIAENYLEDYKLVNKVRNMFAYTGYYKNKRVTVFASGMGGSSISIYAYELFKFYDVKKIIRIGSCGSYNKDIKIKDIVLADKAFSFNSFPMEYASDNINLVKASEKLTKHLEDVANKINIPIKKGTVITSAVFDLYIDKTTYVNPYPKEINEFAIAVEMEAFILYYLAFKLNKEASCLLTVVDSLYDKNSVSSNAREKSLNDMILLALSSL